MNRYFINVTPKANTRYNPMHDLVQNTEAVILEAKIGERGWIAYKLEEDIQTPWHRLHTSNIEDIKEEDSMIRVVTENTLYILTKVE